MLLHVESMTTLSPEPETADHFTALELSQHVHELGEAIAEPYPSNSRVDELASPLRRRRMSLKNATSPEEEDEVIQLENFIKDTPVVLPAVKEAPPSSETQPDLTNPGAMSLSAQTHEVNGVTDTVNSGLSEPLSNHKNDDLDSKSSKVVFVFTGQGAQWQGMGASLLQTDSHNTFKTSIEVSKRMLKDLGSTLDVLNVLSDLEHAADIHDGFTAIPITVALQLALVDLLADANVNPSIVLGHSTGEIAAAYAAGLLTQEECIKIALHFSTALSEHGRFDEKYGMLAIGLPEENVRACIERMQKNSLMVACTNSPKSTTVSGLKTELHELREALEEADVFCKLLKINAAYHSAQMDVLNEGFGRREQNKHLGGDNKAVFYSSVTARVEETLNSDYWTANMTSKVDYWSAMQNLVNDNPRTKLLFIEIGPQPHLQKSTMQILDMMKIESTSVGYLPTLSRGTDAVAAVKHLSHSLKHHGFNSDLLGPELDRDEGARPKSTTELSKTLATVGTKSGYMITSPILLDDEKLFQIYSEISIQLSTLLTQSVNLGSLGTLADSGLDSHLAMLFRTWLRQKYDVTVSVQQILDLTSLLSLASLIVQDSAVKSGITHDADNKVNNEVHAQTPSDIQTKLFARPQSSTTSSLPKFPLSQLQSTLEGYYTSMEVFGSKEELAHTRKVIEDFNTPDSGQKLQGRLLDRDNDPNLDCWLADLYNSSAFLDRNGPLVPFSSFFYTHKLCDLEQTQSERAAIITIAALDYKQRLHDGLIEPAELNGQPTDMSYFPYLFNTSRLPQAGCDIMERFPGNDYIVVLRKNRAFKVPLIMGETKTSYANLKHIFEAILETATDDGPDVGILTADDRRAWAKNRDIIKVSHEENAKFLHVLEAAMFIVCLDDASPEGAPERARHFHFGDGSNRWNDKSVQFVICQNGISGFIGDHSMLDAGTVLGLNQFIYKAIQEHRPADTNGYSNGELRTQFEELKISTTSEIEREITRMQADFRRHTSGVAHAFTTYKVFGASLPRRLKCPPKSYFQLVVILASRYHFGYSTALWETVSLGNFHKGRVEINQVLRPCIVELCDVADDPTVPISRKRELLFQSVNVHTASVMRAVRGRGIDRHLTSLRQMVREGEAVPEFFTDPLYARNRPRKIMSHCHETGMAEKGFVLRDPEAIWVHYEVEEESVHFSVTGVIDAPIAFCGLIEKAAESLRLILLGED